MKTKNKHYLLGLFTAILLIGISGCHTLFNNDEEPDPLYLISYAPVQSYFPDLVKYLFDEIVDQYPEVAQIRDRVKHGIIIYKITYKTTFKGEPVIASGLVATPTGEGPFPVISYQNGTNTLHSNAPSENPNFELYKFLETVASTGFIISIPDYLGFGASDDMFHPYLHKESTVQSVLDMLRALEELAALRNFSTDGNLYLTGYSQGGWATMQVHKAIETQYSGEFNLKASVPCAGPYNLKYINEYILNRETYPMPYFAAYIFDSYMHLDVLKADIGSVFSPPYDTIIPTLFDGTKTGQEINDLLTYSPADLFTENYRQNYDSDTTFTSLMNAMEANSVEAWKTSVPTRILHGTDDSLISFQVSEQIFEGFMEKGSAGVALVPLAGMDHSDGIVPAGLFSIQWFLELTE